ncbi:sporulation membrane protein YtaF [Oceanobacillus sp. CAU 1775]
MTSYTGLLLLGIAVSLDGLGVGVSYGIKKTRVPIIAIIIIMLCSGFTVLITMVMGDYLKLLIPASLTEMIGGLILIFLGILTFINITRAKTNKPLVIKEKTILGDMKTVLRSPTHADLDQSGIISKHEAALLGIALALDAFGAGIAASFLHYSAILTAVTVAIMSGAFLFIGLRLGLYLSQNKAITFFTYLPPLILITIGLLSIL